MSQEANYITLTEDEYLSSPHFINSEDIYEVSFGNDPKNDMRYTVGRKYLNGRVEVTFIEYDHGSYTQFGHRRIYIRAEADQKTEKMWKISENQPCMITCKI